MVVQKEQRVYQKWIMVDQNNNGFPPKDYGCPLEKRVYQKRLWGPKRTRGEPKGLWMSFRITGFKKRTTGFPIEKTLE
jgi:hypothetical protein